MKLWLRPMLEPIRTYRTGSLLTTESEAGNYLCVTAERKRGMLCTRSG